VHRKYLSVGWNSTRFSNGAKPRFRSPAVTRSQSPEPPPGGWPHLSFADPGHADRGLTPPLGNPVSPVVREPATMVNPRRARLRGDHTGLRCRRAAASFLDRSTEFPMLPHNRLSIQSKLIILLLLVSLGSIAVTAWIGYSSAREVLTQSVEHQLQGVRVAKTSTIRTMFESLRERVLGLADSKVTIDGLRSFRDAYRALGNPTLSAAENARLDAFYRDWFLPRLDANVDGVPILEQYLPERAAERYLQYHYLAAKPRPDDDGQDPDTAAADTSVYGSAHASYHPSFARAVRIFGFNDVLLVDAETLDIVYTYRKTPEFGTNLATGPYADSQLGIQVRALRNQKERDAFRVSDFEPYRPHLGQPVGFAMSPVFDGPQLLGILVLQFPIDRINAALTGNYGWREEGFGVSGECYLVGADRTVRSERRLMHEHRDEFLDGLRNSPISTRIVDEIARRNSTIFTLPVDTASVTAALNGRSGITTITDFRGERVLSAYGPLDLDSMRWAVIAEIDEKEADAPLVAYGRKVIVVVTGTALVVTVIALLFAYVHTRRLRQLTEGARRLGAGEIGVRVPVDSNDEFGELARVFNEMAQSMQQQTERLEGQVRENLELLHNILPASAIAQRQDGDRTARREFADVSVLFADIIGMEEFSDRVGETRSLEILGDLIETFDEAAEESGIEKVNTIGASYLAVCGLSVTRPDHARRVIRFAQELVRIVGVFNRDHQADLALAVGVNAGPVVGGVIGRRKFLYDLWGVTVAIARRLAAGQGSGIHVTAAVRERLAGQFQFAGPITGGDLGKGPMEYWEVTQEPRGPHLD